MTVEELVAKLSVMPPDWNVEFLLLREPEARDIEADVARVYRDAAGKTVWLESN